MKLFVFLLLATFAVAELSLECEYVNESIYITDLDALKDCFESYTVEQDVIDRIILNLELIKDLYPYTDIAMNPPKSPEGYFKTVNYTSGLEQLKKDLAESDGIVSKVFRPTMKFIDSFHDIHFGLTVSPVPNKYNNIFAPVLSFLPFVWDAVNGEGDKRNIMIHSPMFELLPDGVGETIVSMYEQGFPAKTVDGKDAFLFFSQMFGDYDFMKSPQGSLVATRALACSMGFPLLQYPLENAFDNHTIVFSDPGSTTVTFQFGFINQKNAPPQSRDIVKPMPMTGINPPTKKQEKEVRDIIMNFKPRPVREPHQILTCDAGAMNYIVIPSFTFYGDAADLFLKELVECVALFDTNSAPITIVVPFNLGGDGQLRAVTHYLLMPTADFRTIRAVRKTEKTKQIAAGVFENWHMAGDRDKCDMMKSQSEVDSFWNKTFTDDFGNGVVHERTDKAFEDYKDIMKKMMSFKMTKNVRKPTEIVVATDGICLSACSFLVDNVIRSGSAITVGYGVTNPGDELYAAGQCPSGVINPADYFEEVKDNDVYGLGFKNTMTESYDVSANLNETIPGDYSIIRIDKHTGYYDPFDPTNASHYIALLQRTYAVVEEYKTKCNPLNKKLLLVTDQCTSNKPNAVRAGFACGDNGEWDRSACKVASCKEGYVVDFENDVCVPNTCYPPITPEPSSSSVPPAKRSSSSSSSSSNKSSIVEPMLTLIIAALISLHLFIN